MVEGSCPLNFYVDTMASDIVVGRRQYSEELKAEVMAECEAPGASVAKVAKSRGINANIVHRWRQLAGQGEQVNTVKPHGFAAGNLPHRNRLGIGNLSTAERPTRKGSWLAVGFALGSCGPGGRGG